MSEFTEPESLEVASLEAPKVVKPRAPRNPKAQKLEQLDTSVQEELVEECTPVKKGKGRPKKVVEPVAEDDGEPTPPKPKRVQTESQRENFKKALAKRQENILARKAAKEAYQEAKVAVVQEKKKEIERKVLKKAVVLKKKEILSQACLEDISDEDIPDSVIQKVISKQKAKSAPKAKPVASEPVSQNKYNFV